MAISKESKDTLKAEIDKLQFEKNLLNKRIQELSDKKDSLVARRTVINDKINKIQADNV